MFATTQPLPPNVPFDDGSTNPKINIIGAFAIFVFLVVILRPLGVVTYKWNFSRNFKIKWEKFKWSEVVDRFVNVLVNCLVVTPFMVQTENIMVLKELNEKFMDMERLEKRRNSLKRKTSVMRMSSLVEQPNRQAEVLQDYNGVFMPNMNFFTSAFLYNDFRDLIRDLWWEDPSRWFIFDKWGDGLKFR